MGKKVKIKDKAMRQKYGGKKMKAAVMEDMARQEEVARLQALAAAGAEVISELGEGAAEAVDAVEDAAEAVEEVAEKAAE
ncbi:MAG: hypothetical protein HQL54_00860 [Magnetococcales bacterium]|nr:hypothetical protein [Magnetococcales bacterium]